MPLELSLLLVFLAFCAVMGGVLALCFRERRLSARRAFHTESPVTLHTADRQGNRLAFILLGCIIAGALLALLTAYLVFFRTQY